MTSFEKNGYAIVRKALTEQTVKLLQYNFQMVKDCDDWTKRIDSNEIPLGDGQVQNSFGWYGAYCFESLLLTLQPMVEEVLGKSLYPCYTYARIMYKGAFMEKHKDRPSCQYSTTICIEEDPNYEYPIFIENYDGQINSIILNAGDMLVYNGTELNHWREEFQGKEHTQAFLHYVDANGEYKDFKYDTRPMLGLSNETRREH